MDCGNHQIYSSLKYTRHIYPSLTYADALLNIIRQALWCKSDVPRSYIWSQHADRPTVAQCSGWRWNYIPADTLRCPIHNRDVHSIRTRPKDPHAPPPQNSHSDVMDAHRCLRYPDKLSLELWMEQVFAINQIAIMSSCHYIYAGPTMGRVFFFGQVNDCSSWIWLLYKFDYI